MKPSLFIPLSGLLFLLTPSHANHLQLSGRPSAPMAGTTLGDSQNMVYTTNITLNDVPFSVLVDTGSSDLWVSSSVPGADPQNFQAEVDYASGSASGNVMSATLTFAGFSVDSQFFIEAPDGSAASGADGLIGLGPSSSSNIRQEGNSDAANPPLDRIFTSNSSLSPFIAILLQRSDDPDERYPGDLAVGEVLTDYNNILSQPKLPVTLTPIQGGQHWQTFLDVNGLIGPNGQRIPIKTQVTGAQTENATIIFDTGFTLPQVSPDVAQALYGDIPGAVLTNASNLGEVWTLPCDQQVNATFIFAGVDFPVHPLDLNSDEFHLDPNENGQATCVGMFQPYSFDISEEGRIGFDMILGMAFLRNAYLLVNFGNLVNAATPSTDTAYIQLLPMTNATQAAQDFAQVRGGNGTEINSSNGEEFGKSSGSHSRTSSFLKHGLIGLIIGAAVLLVLLCVVVACCCRRRRNVQNTPAPAAWVTPSYQPINAASPQAAYDMHMTTGAPPSYNPAYAAEYRTAWDARY